MLERVNVTFGRFFDEISVEDLAAALFVEQPLGTKLTTVIQPIRNPARQTADSCSGEGRERGDDGGVHRWQFPTSDRILL